MQTHNFPPIMNLVTPPHDGKKPLPLLALAALGVVFGDIGTSPLYAMKECFGGSHGIPVDADNVLGVLSLIFWSLVIVVSAKYILYVLRADNRGEGGELALLALLHPRSHQPTEQRMLIYLGLFGAALLYGDGMVTPAISVLSAVEGLSIATPVFSEFVIPVTIAILIALFLVQRHGTARIGSVFGPVILTWFGVLALLGLGGIVSNPAVLAAINPSYALHFLAIEGWHAFIVLGSVFLVVTGGEALFADMGHFGRAPIRLAWFAVAFPALLLNYFGQGANLLLDPSDASNPFYRLAPEWALYPLVILATSSATIASQAMISGAFSLTRQAVQLGYLPRVKIDHTSEVEIGQIYVPLVNTVLMVATVWLVLQFRTSSNLAAAYGIAVSTSMVISTTLMFFVARDVWRWRMPIVAGITALLLTVELSFLSSNLIKLGHGGWFTLLVGSLMFTVMSTWWRGRQLLAARMRSGLLPLESFVHGLTESPVHRVPGTAIFLTSSVDGVPAALLHHLNHNKVLHDRLVVLMIATEEVPQVPEYDRVQVQSLGNQFYRAVAHYGFMESPNVPEALRLCAEQGLEVSPDEATYFLGRETIFATDHPGMAIWREELFVFLSRNAERATSFFRIPRDKVIEIGLQIEI